MRNEHATRARALPWTRFCVLLLPILGTALLLTSAHQTFARTPAADVIVCWDGPPSCDYATIQAGIDAASFGDTVLVGAGVYNEAITLKSGVRVVSAEGPTTTIISQHSSPLVSASSVTSATLSGFTIRGVAPLSPAVGIAVTSSDVTIADTIVEDFHGTDGTATEPNGGEAVAIDASGMFTLTVRETTIRRVNGGDGLEDLEGGATGGGAIAIRAIGVGTLDIVSSTIDSVTGGSSGTYVIWPYECAGEGGRAVGLLTEEAVHTSVVSSTLDDIRGGEPCEAFAGGCVFYAGQTTGISVSGGSLRIQGSTIRSVYMHPAHRSSPAIGIAADQTAYTTMRDSHLDMAGTTRTADETQSPYCNLPPGNKLAIHAQNSDSLILRNNVIERVYGAGYYGFAVGLHAEQVPTVNLHHNTFSDIIGGVDDSYGIDLDNAVNVDLTGNVIDTILGGDGPDDLYYLDSGTSGGDAIGVRVDGVTVTATNNVINNIQGGDGSYGYGDFDHLNRGGYATALRIRANSAEIHNNTIHKTVGGLSNLPDAPDGISTGVDVVGTNALRVSNNSVVRHETGLLLSSSRSIWSDYNSLWENETDYVGVISGSHDIEADPMFVDPDDGNLNLSAGSPLIDAGYGAYAPAQDYQSDPRPSDGNDDGRTAVDIGADEYWPRDRLFMTVELDPATATPGETVAYSITLTSYGDAFYGRSVHHWIPAQLALVPESLHSTKGDVSVDGDWVIWELDLARREQARMRFDVVVDASLVGPLAIHSLSELHWGDSLLESMSTIVFIEPEQLYMPLVNLEP